MNDSIILTDIDGVCLNWEFAFSIWANDRGLQKLPNVESEYDLSKMYGIGPDQAMELVKTFNESAAIGFLPPLRDAVHYIKRLHEEHGFVFHCITSLSANINAKKLRVMNLNKLFGNATFEQVICLETGAAKDQALAAYKNSQCYWIDDLPVNVIAGKKAGLRSILMGHSHNRQFVHEDIPTVKNWKEIYSIIVNQISP